MNAADTTCKRRNVPPTRLGDALAKRKNNALIRSAAIKKPTTGDMISGNRTLLRIPSHCTLLKLNAAMPEPTTPPISAWLEDDGMPKYQVKRFQIIAPTSAPITSSCDETKSSPATS